MTIEFSPGTQPFIEPEFDPGLSAWDRAEAARIKREFDQQHSPQIAPNQSDEPQGEQ